MPEKHLTLMFSWLLLLHEMINHTGIVSRAEAIIDVNDTDTGRTAIEH